MAMSIDDFKRRVRSSIILKSETKFYFLHFSMRNISICLLPPKKEIVANQNCKIKDRCI